MSGRRRSRVSIVVGVLLGLGLIPLFAFWDIPFAAAKVNSAADAYRRAGLPWVAKDLDPVPPVTESDNAVPILLKAIAKIPPGAADPLQTWSSVKHTDKAKVQFEVATYADGLALAHEAARRPRLDFHRDRDRSSALQFPEAASLGQLVHAFVVRAELEAEDGRCIAAASDLRDAMRISSLVGTEPHPYSLTCSLDWEGTTATAIERCIVLTRLSKAEIKLIREASGSAVVPQLGPALLGQSYDGLSMYRNYERFAAALNNSEAEIDIPHTEIVRDGIPSGLTARALATRHMQGWVEIKQAMDRLGDDPVGICNAEAEIATRYYNHFGTSYRLSAIAFPTFTQLAQRLVDLKARLTAIRRG